MAEISYTYMADDTKEFQPLPEGDYECFIDDFIFGSSATGNEYIRIKLRVRDDVEQEGKNRVISDFIRKEEDGIHFNQKKINRILGTQKIENGVKFDNIEAVGGFLRGRDLIAHLKINEWNGKKDNSVYFYKPTEHPSQTMGKAEEKKAVASEDDDLPF